MSKENKKVPVPVVTIAEAELVESLSECGYRVVDRYQEDAYDMRDTVRPTAKTGRNTYECHEPVRYTKTYFVMELAGDDALSQLRDSRLRLRERVKLQDEKIAELQKVLEAARTQEKISQEHIENLEANVDSMRLQLDQSAALVVQLNEDLCKLREVLGLERMAEILGRKVNSDAT